MPNSNFNNVHSATDTLVSRPAAQVSSTPALLESLLPSKAIDEYSPGSGLYDELLEETDFDNAEPVSLIDSHGVAFAVCVELPSTRFPDPDTAAIVCSKDGVDRYAIWRLRLPQVTEGMTVPKGASFDVPPQAVNEGWELSEGAGVSLPWESFASPGASNFEVDGAGTEIYDASGYKPDGPVIALDEDGKARRVEKLTYLPDRRVTFMRARSAMTKQHDWKDFTVSLRSYVRDDLTNHLARPKKDGESIVFGSSAAGRKKVAMRAMEVIGFDLDNGQPVNDVIDRLRNAGLSAVGYTTWSHRKRMTMVPRDSVLRALKIEGRDPDLEDCKDFLIQQRGYRSEIVADATIISDEATDGEGKLCFEIEHLPIEKMRIIIPLSEAVQLVRAGITQTDACNEYTEKVLGLASKLGIRIDVAASDIPRIFYAPMHAKGTSGWRTFVVRGRPLDYDTIPRMLKTKYRDKMKAGTNAFLDAGDGLGGEDKKKIAFAPSGKNLSRWWGKYGQRFYYEYRLNTPQKCRLKNPQF